MRLIKNLKLAIIFASTVFLFTGCMNDDLNDDLYYTPSEFYGAWEFMKEQDPNSFATSSQYVEYVKFMPDGAVYKLKVYDPEYYKGSKDLSESTWTVKSDRLTFGGYSYTITYSSGSEIFLSTSYQLYKIKKIPDLLWEYYSNPDQFKEYESVDQEGTLLNYKSEEDFYGSWKLTYGSDSFGSSYNDDIEEYVDIKPEGKLIYTKKNNTIGITDKSENSWRLKKNIFYWDILNYDIEYCMKDEISLRRSATHLILKRI